MAMTAQQRRRDVIRTELRISSRESLADDLFGFGQIVGPRRGIGTRTKGEKEDYCLRRWLIAATAAGQLDLPLTIHAHADQSPDFVLTSETGELGIEVTEAGSASYQSWLTRMEVERKAIPYRQEGYAGNQAERIAAQDIAEAVRRKVQKARAGTYAGTPRCDLLVYENSESGWFADQGEVIRIVSAAISPDELVGFQRTHLLFGDNLHFDLFGNARQTIRIPDHYPDDWSGWLKAQADQLRSGSIDEFNRARLAEELESLAASDQRALASQVRRAIAHLLKWQFQPARRSRSWELSIFNARQEVEKILRANPSLANRLGSVTAEEYAGARKAASIETRLPVAAFPADCPYAVDEILDSEFMPEAPSHD